MEPLSTVQKPTVVKKAEVKKLTEKTTIVTDENPVKKPKAIDK